MKFVSLAGESAVCRGICVAAPALDEVASSRILFFVGFFCVFLLLLLANRSY
jgi:hypothetical protein